MNSFIAVLIRLITGARHEGVAPPEQAIYFANHSSHLDFITIWASLPAEKRIRLRAVAAADYWGKGPIARIFNLYLVDRGQGGTVSPPPEPAGGPRPVGKLHGQTAGLGAVLTAGDSLLIFPEGTRGDGADIAEFQPGLARLARAFPGVPVVPIALRHLNRMLPKGKWLPLPLLATATFLEPLAMGAEESDEEFLDRARVALRENTEESWD